MGKSLFFSFCHQVHLKCSFNGLLTVEINRGKVWKLFSKKLKNLSSKFSCKLKQFLGFRFGNATNIVIFNCITFCTAGIQVYSIFFSVGSN